MTTNAIITMVILVGIFFGGFTAMMTRLLKMEKKQAELESMTTDKGAK